MVAIASTAAPNSGERASSTDPHGRCANAGYLLAATAVLLGWALTRSADLVDPADGFGYWLGIVGASLMATLLLYPIRKRFRMLRVLGATRIWFRIHMIFGVLGPLLILYHCNFALGSTNSTIALVCTLLVACSGLVGRYLYAKIYQDLDGHRRDLEGMTDALRVQLARGGGAARLLPGLLERMAAVDEEVLTAPGGETGKLLLPLKLAVTTSWTTLCLSIYASRQFRKLARRSPVIASQRKRLTRTAHRFIRDHQRRVRRVAELRSYEQLFSLWHLFHLPCFYMLVLTAVLHVLAVHVY